MSLPVGRIVSVNVLLLGKDILSSGWEDDCWNHSWREGEVPDELNWN
jgi:hypothetical protein